MITRKAGLAAALLFWASTCVAEVAVIVHPSNNAEITQKYLKKIYLGRKKSFSNGNPAVPLSLESGSESRTNFCAQALGRSEAQFQSFWSRALFTGKGTPPKEVSTAEMLQLVSRNPDMIGYVDATDVNDSVKVIATF